MSSTPTSQTDLSPVVEIVSSQPYPAIPTDSDVLTIHVTLPPNSPGSHPHRHPGPAFGYVIEGELRFECEGEPVRIVKAGESFWEPGGDVVHYQDANNLTDGITKFVVILFSAPGAAPVTEVPHEELHARRGLRIGASS